MMGKHDKKAQNGVTKVASNKQGNSNDANMAAVGGVSQHSTQWSNMQYIQPQSNIQPHIQLQTNNTMSNDSMLSGTSAQMQMGDVGQGANQGYSGQQSISGTSPTGQQYIPPMQNNQSQSFMQMHESGGDSNGTIIQMITQMNNNFTTRLGSIEQRLSKLGQIENEISLMRAEVLNMKEVNLDFNKRLMDAEIFCQNNSDTFDEIKQRNDMNSQQVTMLKNENQSLKSDLSQIKADFHNLKEDYLDLKSRSMQENLLFFGLAEQRPADGQMRPERENVEAKLRDFLSNELSLESPNIIENIVFDRVHRLGPPRRDMYEKPRPIIAKFEKFTDRETIRKAGIQLNSNPDPRFRKPPTPVISRYVQTQ